jgi:hypothetical protein
MESFICRRCRFPVEGEAALDPRPSPGPSYMHPACAMLERKACVNEIEERERWLRAAAPELLRAATLALGDLQAWHEAVCEHHACDGCTTCQETIPALQGALAKAQLQESRS